MADFIDTANKYVAWDPIPESAEEIKELIAKNDLEELKNRLGKRIEFGTAGILIFYMLGLRGRMEAGYRFINGLTVLQTTQV